MGGSDNPYPWRKKPETPSEAYDALRAACSSLEELIEQGEADGTLDVVALKRLDKAVTIMKAGFKIVKKVLAKNAVPKQAKPIIVTGLRFPEEGYTQPDHFRGHWPT